jgi:tetratricopeptide (TPR) repeat protein
MTNRRIRLGLAAATAAAVLTLLGGALARSNSPDGEPASRPDAVATRLLEGFAPGDTVAYVRKLERRVADGAATAQTLTLLGLAYQQRARETADPAFYPRSEAVLRRALRLEPRNSIALTGLAALSASRHRFQEARERAKRALRLDPSRAAAWGILGDAEVETGRYAAAFAAFERMVSLKPNAASYARISYARELLGRIESAIAAMRRAVTAASAVPEPAAWALVNLGNLYAEAGGLEGAAREYRHALVRFPSYAPALAGLARLALWRGKLDEAVALYREALAAQPLPEYAVGLGDASARLGRVEESEHAYRRAETLEEAFAANGGQNAVETALFDLDHDRNLVDALARAREGRTFRPSVEGEHVLAWALFKNGRCREARRHSVRALRLGTKDWGAMLHRSLIESCLENEGGANAFRNRALAVNPYALEAFGPLAAHRR